MNLVRCPNGHIYSTRTHGHKCPYCNNVVENGTKNGPGTSRKMQTVSQTQNNDGDGDVRTTAYWDDKAGSDQVVGWLVCIEGPQRGMDYRIRPEKNFIGRSEEMHIHINGDNSISRRNHAVISYNPMERNFFLIPGGGVGLVYQNNEAIYSPVELAAYDVIQMGHSKFVFVPLCGMHFDWDSDDKDNKDVREPG
ncbi:MAG TPA: hypothetical protein DDW50_21455 [Firmicutes bacterium]|jgi:hypothetical protein|nr:hypothetical protein [Bacillota bacterium]